MDRRGRLLKVGKKMSARKKPTFEEAVARIEEIVNKLENEQVSLEESIKLYTEGMELSVICRQKLTEAEGKVTMLQKNFLGEYIEMPFDEGSRKE